MLETAGVHVASSLMITGEKLAVVERNSTISNSCAGSKELDPRSGSCNGRMPQVRVADAGYV
jgi:hypothetical protein